MRRASFAEPSHHYSIRILACTAASLLLLIALVRLWPALPPGDGASFVEARAQEVVALETIVPTRQRLMNPPPPAPIPPVVVPDEVILEPEELVIGEGIELAQDYGDDPFSVPGDPDGTEVATAAESYVSARAVRIVEPEYTREARRRKVRAEVHVEVEIDAQGRVRGARVVERYLVGDDDDAREQVAEIGYGLEAAAQAAAERWTFRPARRNGRPVDSSTTLTFRFGV